MTVDLMKPLLKRTREHATGSVAVRTATRAVYIACNSVTGSAALTHYRQTFALALSAAARGSARSPRAATLSAAVVAKPGRLVQQRLAHYCRVEAHLDAAARGEQHILGLDVAVYPSHRSVQHRQSTWTEPPVNSRVRPTRIGCSGSAVRRSCDHSAPRRSTSDLIGLSLPVGLRECGVRTYVQSRCELPPAADVRV